MASVRATTCQLWTATQHRSGLKFTPYTYTPFGGLKAEDGSTLRGTEGEASSQFTQIPALATAAPKNCCGQLG